MDWRRYQDRQRIAETGMLQSGNDGEVTMQPASMRLRLMFPWMNFSRWLRVN
jgi:hypothetical protein